MLTNKDLLNIAELINQNNEHLKDIFVTKKEFNKLKNMVIKLQDGQIKILNLLNTEHEVRYAKLEKVSSIVDDHESRLTYLEKK